MSLRNYDTSGESSRICDLSDQEILAILEARSGRAVAARALDKLKLMFAMAARQRPALAPGLHAAMGLTDLYREALDLTGKLLHVEAGSVAKVLLNAESRKAVPVLKPIMVFPEELKIKPDPSVPVIKRGGVITEDRVKTNEALLALPLGYFFVADVLRIIGCRKETLNNALISLRAKRVVKRIGKGSWEKLVPPQEVPDVHC